MDIMDREYFTGAGTRKFGGCCGCSKENKFSGGEPTRCYIQDEMIASLKNKLTAAITFMIFFLIGFLIMMFVYIAYYYRYGNVFKDKDNKAINPFKEKKCTIDSVYCFKKQ